MPVSPPRSAVEFGHFLRSLRRRAGMNQRDLAAAVGFSEAQISRLETGRRLPDVLMVTRTFVPALGLGDEPRLTSQLIALAAAARGEEPPSAVAPERTAHRVPAADRSHIRLPNPPTDLIGREHEVDQLIKRMLGHSGRLITLVGPPGVGKTRLAVAAAWQLARVYADGAHFIPLAAVDDYRLVAATIAGELALADGGRKPTKSRIIEYLRRKELLLVLDNFEQLIPAAPLIAELLSECGRLRILVTSQERLHLRAEQRFPLHALAREEAARLFVQRAQAIDPTVKPTADDQATIMEICALLDNLPLAIELSAAQLEVLTLDALLATLQVRPLDLLRNGPGDAPSGHTTLRSAIRRSYLLLNDAEQKLFRNLGVFIGGFDLNAIAAIGADSHQLQPLIAKSLVQRVPTDSPAGRYAQLDTLRQFALEELAKHDEEQMLRQLHAAHLQRLVEQANAAQAGGNKKAALDQLEVEIYNLRAALRFLLETAPDAALRLAGDLREFWYVRGYNSEGRRWLARAQDIASGPAVSRASALLAAGQLAMAQSDFAEAHELVEKAHILFAQQNDRNGLAQAHHVFGWLARETEDLARAYRHFQTSLSLVRELENQSLLIQVLTSLATVVDAAGGDDGEIDSYLNECLELLRGRSDTDQQNNNEELAFVLARKGTHEMISGHFAESVTMLTEAAARFAQNGFKREQAWALEELGEAAYLLGDMESASTHLATAEALFTELGEELGLMLVAHHEGHLARAGGRPEQAELHYARSLRYFHTRQHRKMIARCIAGLGCVALETERPQRALTLLTAATAMLAELPRFLPAVELAAYVDFADQARRWCAELAISDGRFWTTTYPDPPRENGHPVPSSAGTDRTGTAGTVDAEAAIHFTNDLALDKNLDEMVSLALSGIMEPKS